MQKTKLFVVATTTLATLGLIAMTSPVQANEVKDNDNTYYVVESGDTLSKISEQYGVDYTVVHANNTNVIANPDLIFVGQKVLVSGKDFDKNKVASQSTTKATNVTPNVEKETVKETTPVIEKAETPVVQETTEPAQTAPVQRSTSGVRYSGYGSLAEAHSHRVNVEHGGNYNAYASLQYNYIGGYGFAKSTWIWLCNLTGTSTTDFSVAHQDQLADKLVEVAFDGDWGNVPRSGGW